MSEETKRTDAPQPEEVETPAAETAAESNVRGKTDAYFKKILLTMTASKKSIHGQ